MKASVSAFGDERLDTDLAAILKLSNAQAPAATTPSGHRTLTSLGVSRRASATIVTALSFALLAGAGFVLLNFASNDEAGPATKPASSELVPAATTKAPDAVVVASAPATNVDHRRQPASSLRRHEGEPSFASTTAGDTAPAPLATQLPTSANLATADAPAEASELASSSGTADDRGSTPAAARTEADEPRAIAPFQTGAELAVARARRDSVAAIRGLRRQ